MAAIVRRPPGPRQRYPGQFIIAMRRDPIAFFRNLAAEHGDIAYFEAGPGRLYFLNHPDLVREVLVTQSARFVKSRALDRARLILGEGLLTSNGEPHLRQRRLVQPAFHRDRIEGYAVVMAEEAARVSAGWQAGRDVDLAREMMRLTLAIVGRTLFSADITGEADVVGRAMTTLVEAFEIAPLPFMDLLERLPIPRVLRAKRAKAVLDAMIYRLIRERRASGRDHGDLLSMLLAARDEEGDRTGMTDVQVRDEAMTLFIAGHETTANALAWTWYLLDRNPGAGAALRAELRAVLGGRPPGFADVPRLPYTRMVLAESLRLYPPAWIMGRRVIADAELGGYTVPADSGVAFSQMLVHRDPRFFPDPERFDPLRWTPEAQATRPLYAYFPFGAGPRGCIGEQFAWMEGILVLATLAARWRPVVSPQARMIPLASIVLRPRYGVPARLEPVPEEDRV